MSHIGHVAALHPDGLPVRTTCGVVRAQPPSWKKLPVLKAHLWRYRWMRESVLAARATRRIDAPVVPSDVRLDVDAFDVSGALSTWLGLSGIGACRGSVGWVSVVWVRLRQSVR